MSTALPLAECIKPQTGLPEKEQMFQKGEKMSAMLEGAARARQ